MLRRLRFRVTREHRQPADERHVDDARDACSCAEAFGWGLDDFEWLTINTMKSAFAPFPERLRIINGARSSRATRCSRAEQSLGAG